MKISEPVKDVVIATFVWLSAATGEGVELLGYKLDYPSSFTVQTPRRDLERVFGPDAVQEATLKILGSQTPIHGLIDELTPSNAVLICRNARGRLQPDGEAVLHLEMPKGGVVDDLVRIVLKQLGSL